MSTSEGKTNDTQQEQQKPIDENQPNKQFMNLNIDPVLSNGDDQYHRIYSPTNNVMSPVSKAMLKYDKMSKGGLRAMVAHRQMALKRTFSRGTLQ